MKRVSILALFSALLYQCCATFAVADESLSKPSAPVVELLEVVPTEAVPTQTIENSVTVDSPAKSFASGCIPFPTVSERNQAVDANVFGPVPTTNGVLPANMPLGVPFDGPVAGTEYVRISSSSGNGEHTTTVLSRYGTLI